MLLYLWKFKLMRTVFYLTSVSGTRYAKHKTFITTSTTFLSNSVALIIKIITTNHPFSSEAGNSDFP